MKPNIDDLLKALSNPNKIEGQKTLENNKDTWARIANRDSFSELDLESSDLSNFLQEWVEANPYSSIN